MGRNILWLFWEGPCPPYVRLCLRTIRRHHPGAVLLDRARFEAMRTTDRDVDLARLSPNHLSDYVRAWLLAHHGGGYVDADCIMLRPLDPLFAMAEVHGFVGYREPQDYMSCNFMVAAPGTAVAADHYARVAERVRRGGPLKWLELASMPMDRAIAAHGAHALILPTASVMPIPWNEMGRLEDCREDADHAARFAGNGWCAMLANAAILRDPATRKIAARSENGLLGDRSLLGYLLRLGLGLPGLAPSLVDSTRYAAGAISRSS